jgi:cytochrome d ubiquinol oxidase subunit I
VTTEVGRQPWVVYRVMTTTQAVTNSGSVPISYGALAAAYVLVAAGAVWVLVRLAAAPLREPESRAAPVPG